MESMKKDAEFVQDREDLISLLRMRFGEIPVEMIYEIYDMNELDMIDRLILVAANAPSFDVFQEEMNSGKDSFRIIGERFNPLSEMQGQGDE